MNVHVLRMHANAIETLHPNTSKEAVRLLRAAATELERITPAAAWVTTEVGYSGRKYGTDADDQRTRAGWAEWWGPQLANRLTRADLLMGGGASPLSVQALGKLAATAIGCMDSYLRVHPAATPPAGRASGR